MRSSRGRYILSSMLIVCLSILMSFFLPSCTNYEEATNRGNASGNIVNGGYAAQRDGWIYYVRGNILHKMKLDGSEQQQLRELDGDLSFLNATADGLYFQADTNEGDFLNRKFAIFEMSFDGKELERIADCAELSYLTIVNNYMYFCVSASIQRMNLSDGETQIVLPLQDTIGNRLRHPILWHVCATDDWVYFSGLDDGLQKVGVNGESQQSMTSEDPNKIMSDEDWIYYSQDGEIFRMREDGSDLELLIPECIGGSFNISKGWVYYRENREDGVFKVKLDGTEKQEILQEKMSHGDYFSSINIVGDWIYFHSNEGSCYFSKTDGSDVREIK